MLIDSVVNGFKLTANSGSLVNFVVAAVSVFPYFNLVSIVASIDPAVDSVLATCVVNPSMKLMRTSVDIKVLKNFMRFSTVCPRSDCLSLTGNAGNFWDNRFCWCFRTSSRYIIDRAFTGKRVVRYCLGKRGILAVDGVAVYCSKEKSESN